MGLRVLSAKQVQAAWRLANDSQSTQAFDPWFGKLVRLASAFPTETISLLAAAFSDADAERFDRSELPAREAILTGRADRSAVFPSSASPTSRR